MDKLPPELVSMIAAHLDITSIGALRRTSKFTSKLITPIFLQSLKHQNTDLSKEGLHRLYNLSCSPTLSPAISTLTLTCLYYHYNLCSHNINTYVPQRPYTQGAHKTPQIPKCTCRNTREWILKRREDQNRFAGEDMFSILSDILRNLKNVRHINLEASVVCDVELRHVPEDVPTLQWRNLWTNAIQSYRILLLSISSAAIHLDGLSIYQSTNKSSIPTHDVFEPSLFSGLERENFASFAAHLKNFSISLATTTLPLRPRLGTCGALDESIHLNPYGKFDISRGANLHDGDQRVDLFADMGGIARLLHMMPNLESLHIHLCTTVNGILSPNYYQEFLATLFQDDWHFPKLSHLLLRGFRTSQDDLYGVLSRHVSQLRTLGLENITLSSGSWEPVFSLLSRDARLLEKLRLSVLWSSEPYGNRMNLAPVYRSLDADDPYTQSDREEAENGEQLWYTRSIRGDEVRQSDGLQFRPMVASLGSTKSNWYVQHRISYGPF